VGEDEAGGAGVEQRGVSARRGRPKDALFVKKDALERNRIAALLGGGLGGGGREGGYDVHVDEFGGGCDGGGVVATQLELA
jgi:hypothetical protein